MVGRGASVQRIAVAVSGGVDSAVAAMMLKDRGCDVHGVFMRNWDEREEVGACAADGDCDTAAWVCDKLRIPFTEMNFVRQYWTDVFQYVLSECERGRTPNPDLLCNRHIKFGSLALACRERLSADYLATGHYARLLHTQSGVQLLRAVDESKDQSFFLSQVPLEALSKAVFPLGGLLKSRVRQMATQAGLVRVANKKDSTGICFIGNRDFPDFISQYVSPAPGQVLDHETGCVVGRHEGLHHYTQGQRCAAAHSALTKYFVVHKDTVTNDITVCGGHYHPALYCDTFSTGAPHWLAAPLAEGQQLRCQFRFQHRKPLLPCTVRLSPPVQRTVCGQTRPVAAVARTGAAGEDITYCREAAGLHITLDEPIRAIAPGQFAVLYRGEQCLGSATITQPGPSVYDNNTDNCRTALQDLRRLLPTLSSTDLAQHIKAVTTTLDSKQADEYKTRVTSAKENYYRLVNTPLHLQEYNTQSV